jgi:hypothetical protein
MFLVVWKQGSPITTLQVHHDGRKLLIYAKNGQLKTMDVRLFRILTNFGDADVVNSEDIGIRLAQGACFSPCGNFVFAGRGIGQM